MIDTAVRSGTTFSLERPDGTWIYEIMLGADELVRCRSTGFWTLEWTDLYLADLERALVQARSAFGLARVLVDLADSVVQSPEVVERFRDAEPTLWGPHDRHAFVAESALKRMQLRRALQAPTKAVFMTVGEAERWLLEHR